MCEEVASPPSAHGNGKCIVGEVIEETGKVTKWMCTAECKLPDADAREKINALMSDFEEKRIPALRRALALTFTIGLPSPANGRRVLGGTPRKAHGRSGVTLCLEVSVF